MNISELFFNIGQMAGILAFFLLSFLIFSGDTARFWNKYIGLDKIIKFQKKFSYFVAVFVILHPLFFIISKNKIADFLIPDFSYMPLSIGILAFYIFVCVMICSALYKRISYHVWQYIHVLTYILFFFALYHAYNAGTHGSTLMPAYIITMLFIIIGIVYRTIYKIKNKKTEKYTVINIKEETHDTFTLNVEGLKTLDFQAGQFCFLRIEKNNLYARHPFTIASAPSKSLSFTIKEAGRFTKTAKELKAGETIFVDGPFGNFIPKENKPLVFIAGGVGITPFMSIIRDHIQKDISQPITLIYGSRTQNDIIFKNELDEIKKDWFKKVYMLQDIQGMTIEAEQGFINSDIINKYVTDVNNSLYYICGPEGMKNAVKKTLNDIGVSRKNIFVEDFFW